MAAMNPVHISRINEVVNLEQLSHLPESITLLELVYAISAISEDDQVVVDTVITMLAEGRVRLRGNFRGASVADFKI
jgi:hypothetical protein